MPIRLLHTNDMHGTLTPERTAKLAEFRSGVDLYFDSGDAIKTGNLGIPLKTEPVWAELDRLRCTASVLGNRETHVLEGAFRAKIAGAAHPVMCGNLRKKDGSRPLPRTLEIECRGIKIGVVAVMVPMVTERMSTKAASAYLWDPPIATAAELGEELRPRVDLLIALTHIGHRQDQELARRASFFDAVLGGHSHTVLEVPERIGSVAICQGGSHCRYVGLYEWDGREFTGRLEPFAPA
jgi:2',3'-cyclic-nucleotide 2'-phosphodiesterase (5'-nucleotidase family)